MKIPKDPRLNGRQFDEEYMIPLKSIDELIDILKGIDNLELAECKMFFKEEAEPELGDLGHSVKYRYEKVDPIETAKKFKEVMDPNGTVTLIAKREGWKKTGFFIDNVRILFQPLCNDVYTAVYDENNDLIIKEPITHLIVTFINFEFTVNKIDA